MGFFDRLIGGSPQDGPPQISETEKNHRISEISVKIRDANAKQDFSALSLDDLNFFLEHGNLGEAQRNGILNIAKRPEVASQEVFLKRTELLPLPSAEVLREKLAPLSETEVKKRLEELKQDILAGNITLLMKGNNAHVNQNFTKADECGIRSNEFMGKSGLPDAESPLYLDKLVAGYKRARAILSESNWNSLTSYASDSHYIRDNGFPVQAIKKDKKDTRDFNGSDEMGRNSRFTRADYKREGKYFYMRSKTLQCQLRNSELKSSVTIDKNKIQKETSIQAFPAPALDFIMSLKNPGGPGTRTGYLTCTLLFLENAGVNSARSVLNGKVPESKQNSRYEYYMHALATNPGFFLEGLRSAVPEALQAVDRGKQFYGNENGPVNIERDIPELEMIGQSREMQFVQIAP